MGDSSEHKKTTVLLTGFGPFGSHVVNSSWVSVKELSKEGIGADIDLIIEEIPVVYDIVSSKVPHLWQKYKPDLVVHVGVSSIAEGVTLEQQAHNTGYDKPDVQNKCPTANECVRGCSETCITSQIDMIEVCKSVKCSCSGINTVVSYEPGRYLCDFIYFTSLNIDKSKTAFIHVPPLDKPYSSKQLATGIRHAVLAMLNQLKLPQCW